MEMRDRRPDESADTQETDTGHEIPVPKRREFYDALEKASEPDADEDESNGSASGEVDE